MNIVLVTRRLQHWQASCRAVLRRQSYEQLVPVMHLNGAVFICLGSAKVTRKRIVICKAKKQKCSINRPHTKMHRNAIICRSIAKMQRVCKPRNLVEAFAIGARLGAGFLNSTFAYGLSYSSKRCLNKKKVSLVRNRQTYKMSDVSKKNTCHFLTQPFIHIIHVKFK